MPVYNAEKYLSESIQSILTQTLSCFEFLIVDDASTDSSYELLKAISLKDKRIRIYRMNRNVGLAKSLNTLIPKTKGKYIARMDADDMAFPNRLQKQVEFLEKNTDVIACGGQVEIIDELNQHVAYKSFPQNPSVCYNTIMNFMVIQPPLLMAKGSVMRKLRYDNHIFGNDDISLHFKLLEFGKLSNIKDFILQYRYSLLSLTHKNPKKVFFLALRVRLRAILYKSYSPPSFNFLLAILESFIVLLLPNALILYVFSLIRTHKNFSKNILLKTNLFTLFPSVSR